jgi:uncharacterized protein YjbI with pentapeptide repeats
MPCAFCLDRPKRGCQFVVPDADLIEFDGKSWCVWHLPLGSDAAESPKSQWDDARIESFNERVLDLVDRVRASDKPLNLWGVVFPGSVDFRRYAGENALPGVWFDQATFGGRALFSECTFSGIASFANTTFRDSAGFHEVAFRDLAIFSDATFCDRAIFDRASFARMANFTGAKFSRGASFIRAVLHAALFAGATFGDEARFDRATFSGYQSGFFWAARFKGLAAFRNAVFSGHASFEEVAFDGDALFNGDPTGEGRALAADIFPATITFRSAKFSGRANFTNRRFLSATDFCDASFQVAPEFHNAVLSQDTSFAGTRFLDRKGTEYVDAAMAYRTLKLAMESVRARDEEAQFYGYEQQSLRARKDTPWAAKSFSWLYEKTAMYGQSFVRPMVWLLVVFAAFSIVYLVTFRTGPVTTWEDGERALRFALQQVFQPFGAFRGSIRQGATAPVPFWLAFVATLHSLLTFSFLALFLLALRRRFRLN